MGGPNAQWTVLPQGWGSWVLLREQHPSKASAAAPLLLRGCGMVCYGFDVLSTAAPHSDGLQKHKQNKPCPPQVVYDHGVYHSLEDLTETHIPCS